MKNTHLTQATAGLRLTAILFICLAAGTYGSAQAVWNDQTDVENYTARHECSFVQAGDRFYLFGGRENPRTLDVYDYQNKTWSAISNSAPQSFNHFQAIEYQGLIWVIGAFKENGFPDEPPADYIWAYDPAADEWIQGPEIPAARRRGSAGLAMYDDKFYIVGGNTIGHNGGYVNWFDVYDPATGVWTVLPNAPHARDHFHVAVLGDKLYAAGGRLSGGPEGTFEPVIPEVDVYDLSTMTWSTLPAAQNLPTPRAGAAVAAFGGELYVIGGEIGDDIDDAVDATEAYDPASETWSVKADLLIKRHGTQAIVSGPGIHITAGSNTKAGSGKMKNMEYYGTDSPVGSPLAVGVLSAPTTLEIPIGGNEQLVLDHGGGNTGIVLGQLEITGADASEFTLETGDGPAGLIPPGGSTAVTIAFTGTSVGQMATLTIPYGASGTETVNLISVADDPGETLTLEVALEGRTDYSGAYAVDVYDAMDLSTPASSYPALNADVAGTLLLPNLLPSGSYRVRVQQTGFLQRVVDVTLDGATTLPVPELLAGDVNGDNFINIDDFDLLAVSFFTFEGNTGFNAAADFDGNGFINIDDFDLLANNFFTAGEDIVPD